MSEAQGDLCRFPFGKYKGQTVDSVLSNEPSYVMWFYENVAGQSVVSHDMFERAFELVEQRHGPTCLGRGSGRCWIEFL